MKNIEIKKEIQEAIKNVKNYRIDLTVFTGDGEYHEGPDPIYNTLTIWSGDNIIYDIEYGSTGLTESEENYKILRDEQKKIYNYLKKHFVNITVGETTV